MIQRVERADGAVDLAEYRRIREDVENHNQHEVNVAISQRRSPDRGVRVRALTTLIRAATTSGRAAHVVQAIDWLRDHENVIIDRPDSIQAVLA